MANLHACSTAQRTDWRQSGVLQGPTVQLRIGLTCTKELFDPVPAAPQDIISFVRSGSAARRWPTQDEGGGCGALHESSSRRRLDFRAQRVGGPPVANSG